jgi:uncharacterized protein with ParB-like and HNH nuclease domain
MDLNAVPKTINDLLSVKKRYLVPRFQREYQWAVDKVRDLWEDVSGNIKSHKANGTLEPTEYFIGPLVLIGKDTSKDYQIVDGQQRLTTITLFLRALVDSFDKLGEKDVADALFFDYIEGKDEDGKPFFKLHAESSFPYLGKALQDRNQELSMPTESEEHECLHAAYVLCQKLLSEAEIKARFPQTEYLASLKCVRDQFLRFVKVIYVTVADEEDAYTIFETLNARGLDLTSYDLVRNAVLKKLNKTHPDDDAKGRWTTIRQNCISSKVAPETFLRHFWLSRYGNTTEDRLYKSFKLEQRRDGFPSLFDFLCEVETASNTYRSVALPQDSDWKEKHKKSIYLSLRALALFRLTQVRPLVLAVLESKIANDTDKKNFLTILEHFHFCFSAVCSAPPYGLDRKYGKIARDLRAAKNRSLIIKMMRDLAEELRTKLAGLTNFADKFCELAYSNDDDSQKRVIQYFFEKYELHFRKTLELLPHDSTLEHIAAQKHAIKNYDRIGNLLPIGETLNGLAGANDFPPTRRTVGCRMTTTLCHYR